MNRRKFLQRGAAAVAALSLSPLDALTQETLGRRRGAAKRIIIVGAGLAGLTAGYELSQIGHDVTILEAQSRAGGRVHTFRSEAFDDNLYAEAGAARIPADHEWTLRYARQFNLALDAFYPGELSFVDYNQATRNIQREWAQFAEATSRRVPIHLGDGAQNWLKIRGGNDLLPQAFAARLSGRIIYSSPVARIAHERRGVQATFTDRSGARQTMAGDYLICAIPFTTLRRIEIEPRFSANKQNVIERLAYDSAARIHLQMRNRFWTGRGLNGFAASDDPPQEIWSPTFNQSGTRGILSSYVRNEHSQSITSLTEDGRVRFMLERMERVFPGARESFERGVTKCWDADEWVRGAWARVEDTDADRIKRREGRVHFAGEHASRWGSWMQGAIQSGFRAAREVNEA